MDATALFRRKQKGEMGGRKGAKVIRRGLSTSTSPGTKGLKDLRDEQ